MSVDLDVDEWAEGTDEPAPPEPPRPPKFPTLPAFVEHLLSWYRRDEHGVAWCPQWWQHPEAVIRLRATWRAYETMRDPAEDDAGDGTWESAWIRDHVDVHLGRLLADSGPFGSCSVEAGHRDPLPPLRCEPPPPEWWTEADTGL